MKPLEKEQNDARIFEENIVTLDEESKQLKKKLQVLRKFKSPCWSKRIDLIKRQIKNLEINP